jgi:hypothetical protein
MGCPIPCAARLAEIQARLCDCCGVLPANEALTLQTELLTCLAITAAGPVNGIDTEMLVVCDPVTGERVYLRYQFDALTGAAISVGTYNADLTPYVGDPLLLVACPDVDMSPIQYAICDDGVQKLVRVCFNNCTAGATTFYNLDGTLTTAPLDYNLVTLGECQENCQSVEARCMCDDVAGNGSNIVNYVDAYVICYRDGVLTSTLVGSYTDDTYQTVYVPVNGVKCDTLGTDVLGQNARRQVLIGAGAFTFPNVLTTAITVTVVSVGNTLTPPTFTDSLGNVSPMLAGESFSFSIKDSDAVFCTLPSITTNAGDRVHIHWTEVC